MKSGYSINPHHLQMGLGGIMHKESTVIETCNSKLLASFVRYCEANPGQRFWQALLNWSGEKFILISDTSLDEMYSGAVHHLQDPYNWEGKNG